MKEKILIISNNPVNLDTNNGITICNLLNSFKKDELINFYIADRDYNLNYCQSYYKITDREVVKSFFIKKLGKLINQPTKVNVAIKTTKKKTAFKMFIRNLLWSMISNKQLVDLKKWIINERPTKILLQIGDSPFLIKIAKRISEEFHLKLFIFNTENYFFKNYNYFNKNTTSSLSYIFFRKSLVKQYNAIGNSSVWIHLTDLICEKYKETFNNAKHFVIRKTPDITPIKYKPVNDRFNVYYFGNVGLGRFDEIVYFSNICNQISGNIKIHVYCNSTTDMKKKSSKMKNLILHNFVSQNELFSIIRSNADLLIHVESFSKNMKIDLIDAFSTKLVDCLNSGIPFLVFSPFYYNFVDYLKKSDCCFISNKENVDEMINYLIKNPNCRAEKIENAKKLILENHNRIENNLKLRKILNF